MVPSRSSPRTTPSLPPVLVLKSVRRKVGAESLPPSVGWTCDLLPAGRTQQKRRCVDSGIGWQEVQQLLPVLWVTSSGGGQEPKRPWRVGEVGNLGLLPAAVGKRLLRRPSGDTASAHT